MDWIKEIPNKPGYYFIEEYGEEYMVEIISTLDGPRFLEMHSLEMHDPRDFHAAMWLGPIESKDTINLWKSFMEKEDQHKDIVYGEMNDELD